VRVDGAAGQGDFGGCHLAAIALLRAERAHLSFQVGNTHVLLLEVVDLVDELLDVVALAVVVFVEFVLLLLQLCLLLFNLFRIERTLVLPQQ